MTMPTAMTCPACKCSATPSKNVSYVYLLAMATTAVLGDQAANRLCGKHRLLFENFKVTLAAGKKVDG